MGVSAGGAAGAGSWAAPSAASASMGDAAAGASAAAAAPRLRGAVSMPDNCDRDGLRKHSTIHWL